MKAIQFMMPFIVVLLFAQTSVAQVDSPIEPDFVRVEVQAWVTQKKIEYVLRGDRLDESCKKAVQRALLNLKNHLGRSGRLPVVWQQVYRCEYPVQP